MKRSLLALLLCLSLSAQAEDSTDTALKNTAIAGTLLSWGMAWLWGDAPLTRALVPTQGQHLALTMGTENHTTLAQLIYARDFASTLLDGPTWQLIGHWEASLSNWWADKAQRTEQQGWMLGLTPVLQYQFKTVLRPYIEFGIGVKYLSGIRIADQYKSTQFQFGDLTGIGIQYRNLQLGFRFLHISNAGIETPNPATNYYTLKMDYRF
ncbi:MAG TPA: acyloxyacyl hydrolase [Sulfurivirga caldicuralii]|nr:acyloxyacyl hydrolase [Sulfurivirga caldicuralii]